MRFELNEVVESTTDFVDYLKQGVNTSMTFGKTSTELNELLTFVGNVVYGYFYYDVVAYEGEDAEDVFAIFIDRLCYDVNLHLPYWFRKYNQIKKLLTTEDFDLLQTSKMTSSSNDTTNSAGGTLQKTATTPTGVSTDGSTDSFTLEIEQDGSGTDASVDTTGFADKYTNAQQKFANATRVEGYRSGNILREGSIKDLLEVLEKLPATFGNEISIALQKHFIFDYDGVERGIYETN